MEVQRMTRRLTLRVGLALIALAMAVSPVLAGGDFNFRSPMNGDAERPVPVDTNAAGVAAYELNDAETELTYRLIVANIDGVTQAHIHCGGPEVAGPVVAFLFGFDPVGVTVNGVLAEGTIRAENVIPRPDSAACPGGVADLADLIEKLRTGGAYTNVHTLEWPGGEIRGQIF
jgi:hypothetical protein